MYPGEEGSATPAPAAKPAAKLKEPAKPPIERQLPEHWRKELDIDRPEHAAVVATGEWKQGVLVSLEQYQGALNRFRGGPI